MAESLLPIRNNLSEPFWEGAARGVLMLPHCVGTDRPFWPPSPSSPFVTAGAVDWREAKAEGLMVTQIAYRRVFQQALASNLPYGIALVELAGGVRLQAHVADPDRAAAPKVGDTVALDFRALAAGAPPVLHVGGAHG